MSIFDKWNQAIDGDKVAKETKEIEKNGGTGDYKEVPHGEYEVKIEKMELKESKKGDPMFSAQFRILTGEFKKNCIFMNQVIKQPFQIHNVNKFLKSLDTDVYVEFNGNYEDYNDMILDVMEAVDGNLEFLLSYTENSKGYNVFEIVEIYEA